MDISLVIPAYNEEKYIGACLESVLKNAPGKFKEIIVVDNGSTDSTAKIASEYAGVRVVSETRKGLVRARQAGLLTSTGEFVAYIDADSRLPTTWFDTLEGLVQKYPRAVSWSGPATYYDAPNILWTIMLSLGWWLTAPIMYRAVGYMILGANFVLRRSAIEAIGGFNQDVEFYGEDMTLAKSLSTQGRTIFNMRFSVITSCRRFVRDGYFRTNWHYVMNFFWPVLFGRPFTKEYTDIRA